MAQAETTAPKAAKPKIEKVDKIADLVGQTVTLGMKNRIEDQRTGELQDVGPAGALIKYESRGSLYHELVPHSNIDSLYVRQPLAE